MFYEHKTISINNHKIFIADVTAGVVKSSSSFEESTFSFIKSWLNNDQAFKLTTSGSTGVPKEINVTRKQLQTSARGTLQALKLVNGERALVCLNTQYIAGIMMLVRCLVGNLKMEIVEPSANPLEELSSTHTFDFCALVPYQVNAILNQYGIVGVNRLKKIIIGGAPLSDSLKNKLKESTSQIYLTYGMTETLSHIALQQIAGTSKAECFTTLPGVKISIDERECLVIETPYLENKVITNDSVELLSATTFRWLGRWDNVINSGGVKFFPEKLEQKVSLVFQSIDIKNEFFIFGLPDEALGNKVVLIIESVESINKQVILNKLKEHLTAYELPKEIISIPHFIRTETGKVKRQETANQFNF